MSKVFAVVGDVHSDLFGLYKYLTAWEKHTGTKIDYLLQVGDWGLYLGSDLYPTQWRAYWNGVVTAPIPTWVNPGNHEGWPEIEAWMKEPDKVHNVRLLPDGGVTDFDGFKVGSIWGNYSPKSWDNPAIIEQVRKQHPTSLKAMHIYKPSVERLKAAGEFNMLITHDAPYGLSPSPRQPAKGIKTQLGIDSDEIITGCPGFNEIYQTSKCSSHFYGHFHSHKILQEPDMSKGKPLVVVLHCWNYNHEQAVWTFER